MAISSRLAAAADQAVAVYDDLSTAYDNPRNQAFYACTAQIMIDRPVACGHWRFGVRGLDLACGTGLATEVACTHRPDVEWYGLDVSAEMLAVARAKPALRSVQFVQSPAEHTPFPDATFDWIMCNIAYHWLHPRVLLEIRRLLASQGRLSLMVPLVTPSGDGTGNQWLHKLLIRFRDGVASRRSQGLTLSALERELAGFQLEHTQIYRVSETFETARELLDVLVSRGSFSAIFGDHADDVQQHLLFARNLDAGPLEFIWHVGLVEARVD
jgi:ubiquinone/menaquinone biosynthesis C-methylase UbiE